MPHLGIVCNALITPSAVSSGIWALTAEIEVKTIHKPIMFRIHLAKNVSKSCFPDIQHQMTATNFDSNGCLRNDFFYLNHQSPATRRLFQQVTIFSLELTDLD